VNPDPFRISFLTVTLDSQVVLALVGLVVAGFVVHLAARREGLDLRAGDWWDLVTGAVLGGRLVWVASHLDYYLRGPLQVVVIIDGGLHPIGLVLGAAYALRSLRRRTLRAPWRVLVGLIALGTVTTFLFERTGCALTTCGAGPLADIPWALRRGDEWRQPLALYQSIVLAGALLLLVEPRRLRRWGFAITLATLTLVELIGLVLGGASADSLAALGLAGGLYASALWLEGGRPSVHSTEPDALSSAKL